VKSREIQRAMFAERLGDRESSRLHYLAAAHLELVLAYDYDKANEPSLAFRSRLSSASCLWRGGNVEEGRRTLEALQIQHPAQTATIQEVLAELTRDYPALAS
jgi:hypothetical protein